MNAATAATLRLIARPHLEDRLDEAFGKRLTLLVAGAGYGKSTLLASWTTDLASAWYTVSLKDRALSTFGAGIAESLSDALQSSERWGLPPTAEGVEGAESIAATISRRLETDLTHDLVLVLDDSQDLRDSAPSIRLVESLCRQGPSTLHVVLASREPLPLRIERLKGQGAVLELTGTELAFTAGEVAAVAEAALGPTGGGIANDLHAITSGWPAGVRLALEALRRVEESARVSALAAFHRPGSPLFTYLAQEVFEQESDETRAAVRRVAEFDRFTPGLCEAIGLDDAPGVLGRLKERGLFVLEREGWLALHALLREFALDAWPLSTEERRELLVNGGRWLEWTGMYEAAARAYRSAPALDELRRILSEHGSELLGRAGGEVVIDFVRSLPAELRDGDVELLAGDAFVERGDIESAVKAYTDAAGDSERLEPRVAWRLARAYQLSWDSIRASEVVSRAAPDAAQKDDIVYFNAWAAGVAAVGGDLDEARRLIAIALDAASGCSDDRALADAHSAAGLIAHSEGKMRQADEHNARALAAAERAGDASRVARQHNNIGFNLLDRGECAAALVELGRAIHAVEPRPHSYSLHAVFSRGVAYWILGRLDEARADFADAVERSGSDVGGRAWALVGLGDVERERGNAELARAQYLRGLEIMQNMGHQDALLITLSSYARTLVDSDPEEAIRVASRALAISSGEGAWALNARGWVSLALGDAVTAARCAGESLEIAQQRGLGYETAEALELAALATHDREKRQAYLSEARAAWTELGNELHVALVDIALHRERGDAESRRALLRAERKLHANGVRSSVTAPAGLLREVSRSAPTPVSIQTLGGFAVVRDGAALSEADWQSRKARELLKILVARRGRAVSRELAMDSLWPGEDPAALGNRFSVALSTLRAVLDPAKRFDPDAFVTATRDSLALSRDVLVDVELFLSEAAEGLALRDRPDRSEARQQLEYAESLYGGDFLDDDPYADWAVPLREEGRATYVAVTSALAELALADGDAAAAVRNYLRVLSADGYDESAHLGLVSALELGGRHGEARRMYRTYVNRMEEIGVTPAAFPTALRVS